MEKKRARVKASVMVLVKIFPALELEGVILYATMRVFLFINER